MKIGLLLVLNRLKVLTFELLTFGPVEAGAMFILTQSALQCRVGQYAALSHGCVYHGSGLVSLLQLLTSAATALLCCSTRSATRCYSLEVW